MTQVLDRRRARHEEALSELHAQAPQLLIHFLRLDLLGNGGDAERPPDLS